MLLLWGCGSPPEIADVPTSDQGMRLEALGPERTGITFDNKVIDDDSVNYFSYTYNYNSGGVAIGDLDGDSLPDMVFVSTRGGGSIYRNEGDLRYKEISATANFSLGATWATGVSLADVNADGALDIYVCASGPTFRPASTRRNLLFINDGHGRFTEQAAAFGLDRAGHSTQAHFADLDGDLDLDCFLVGHRNDFSNVNQVIYDSRFTPVADQSDRLYLNDGHGKFTDHTEESGVASRHFGLAAAIGDMNADGLIDIYVCSDFYPADQLLMNTGNHPVTGVPRFRDEALSQLGHMSYYSMGVDLADYTNDGLPDLCALDMTPSDHKLNKENMASMLPQQFRQMVEHGFHHQYMVNSLQVNNGNDTWSEVSQMAGVDRTDWSWAPLFCDLDNDGWKDLFITNGIVRDVTNSDFRSAVHRIAKEEGTHQHFQPVLDLAPSHTPEKQVFRNRGDLTFEKAMDTWSYHQKTLSTGAAWGDLDRDGDLDLVTVNANSPATIVRNMARESGSGHYLQLALEGDAINPSAIGATATLFSAASVQTTELFTVRGFQSSVEPILHFGLSTAPVDSVVIAWPDHTTTTIRSPKTDQRLVIKRADSEVRRPERRSSSEPLFVDIAASAGLDFLHKENAFDDFLSETLLPQAQSAHGPCAAVADVDGNGTDDVFFGASRGTACVLYLQDMQGRFTATRGQGWSTLSSAEFIGAHFFDADGDGDRDLYLAAGSTEAPAASIDYQDRLFMNDSHGRFTLAADALPELRTSTMCVASNDLDGDGDLDLFVGGRNEPGAWPAPPRSHVLLNERGRFTDVTSTWLGPNGRPGLVTGARFADIDGDKRAELVVCGEWMPVRIWKNTGSALLDISSTILDTSMTGWWQFLEIADLDGDGDNDMMVGNLGLNNKFHPSKERPLKVYMADLDGTGTNDIVLAKCGAQGELPVRGRECSSGQMPFIAEKFPTYKAFANASMEGIYGREKLGTAVRSKATEFASMCFMNQGGRFEARPLPKAAQTAPLRGAVIRDIDGNGVVDLFIGGNLYGAEVETTRYDAGMGLVLLGDGHGGFQPLSAMKSGVSVPADTRHVIDLRVAGQRCVLVVNNNARPNVYARTSAAPGLAASDR